MATVITGVENDQAILSNERVIDMDDVIAYLDPDVSQFTTMLMKVASQEAYSTKVEWLEDELLPRLSTLGATAASANTSTFGVASFTLTLTPSADAGYFRSGDLLRNSLTGEPMLVTTDGNSSNGQVVVTRAVNGASAASSATGAQILIVGNAAAQGASLGTRLITKRVANYNYQQIARNPYGFVNSLRASKLYGGPEPDKERKKKGIEHKRGIEQTLFFGVRQYDTSGTHPRGYCGGALNYISTNVKDAGQAVLTKNVFDNYMRDILQHGSTNKVIFASPVVTQNLSAFLRDAWQPTSTGDKLFGAKVDGWISGAYGYQIPVVVKRSWNDFSATSNGYGGYAFIIDMDYVKLRPLRSTQLLRDRQANDADTYDEEYLTEFSLEFQQEKCHGLIKGVVAPTS